MIGSAKPEVESKEVGWGIGCDVSAKCGVVCSRKDSQVGKVENWDVFARLREPVDKGSVSGLKNSVALKRTCLDK